MRTHPFLTLFLAALATACLGAIFSWRVPPRSGYVVWKIALAVAGLEAAIAGIVAIKRRGFFGWLFARAGAAGIALMAAIALGTLTLIGIAFHNPWLWAGCLWPALLALRWRSFASRNLLAGAGWQRNFGRMLMPRLTTIYAGTMLVSAIRLFTR